MTSTVSAILFGFVVALAASGSADAAPALLHAQGAGSLYTCEGTGLSHVALQSTPAPCCTGHFGCPQLLSNTGLVKPKPDRRT